MLTSIDEARVDRHEPIAQIEEGGQMREHYGYSDQQYKTKRRVLSETKSRVATADIASPIEAALVA
jgi:hypothetical protein